MLSPIVAAASPAAAIRLASPDAALQHDDRLECLLLPICNSRNHAGRQQYSPRQMMRRG
jgi:hypothetical protein